MEASRRAEVLRRNNVRVTGRVDGPAMVFAHGFGCDQQMWRHVAPRFEDTHRVVVFDLVGAGGSDHTAYDPQRYGDLRAYAEDLVEVVEATGGRDVVFVGHSVSSMIGVLAAVQRPEAFAQLVLVGPSARYVDDGDYVGGFSAEDVRELLDAVDSNYLGWSSVMAPLIAGNPDEPASAEELTASFCRADPAIARRFAEVTFTSDNRADLPLVRTPSVVLQCADDIIAPESAGRYVHEHLRDSVFVQLDATGHTPNLTAPDETYRAIRSHLLP